ncbi:hypothetical protein MD484_g8331, partial [Candolleomyces efflorescens]
MERGNKDSVAEEHLHDGPTGSKDGRDPQLKDKGAKDAKDAKPCYCHCPTHPKPKPEPDAKKMTCGHTMGGRNLVVCIDGTANQFGKKNTNVIEMYNLIKKATADNQHTWYNSGIGTYARPHWASPKHHGQVLLHVVDLMIAWDFDKSLLAAYQWICDNYQDGDCIFLFGFSRGAFQARVLAGMIDKIGLLYKGNEKQIPFAYELYADPKTDLPESEQPESSLFARLKQMLGLAQKDAPASEGISLAERFKRAFSRCDVVVHFVGVWDTVSSIGILRGKRMLPRTVDGMYHVCFFRHALALDERRVKFQPELAWGGTSVPFGPMIAEMSTVIRQPGGDKIFPHTLEVWFAGTHSDIGGGNKQNVGMDRSRPPSRWMAAEAEMLGLRLNSFSTELSADEQIEFQESLTWPWYLLEVVPFRRLTFARTPRPKSDTFRPHLGSARKIHRGQKIHSSLILAKTEYQPKARPPPPDFDPTPDLARVRSQQLSREDGFWKALRDDGLSNSMGWLEIDLFGYAELLIKRFLAGKEDQEFEEIVKKYPGDGPQAIYDNTVEVVCLLDRGSPDFNEADGHSKLVRDVAISPEGERIVSGSDDGTIRIWDLGTGEQLCEPMSGGTDINSVEFSPDGKVILSGSDDCTIRLWDAVTGAQIGEPIQGHSDIVCSVKFSADGKYIVSGSDDRTVRIWDAETREQVGEPLRGHTDEIWSVAISPDGKWIVSGSKDETVRLWDFESRVQLREPLQGHTKSVTSVAISPDGKWIVSGSHDRTIRVWDIETGKDVKMPLQGHMFQVNSVTISPDGKHIISGSSDDTICIWDLKTGEQVGEPLRGHTDSVWSVAILPDGKRIVSGSQDHTLRIWSTDGIL